MSKILLIKTGAAGDVVRTTVLLNVLAGQVTWVIDDRYRQILPLDHPVLEHVINIEQIQQEDFDLVLSLEEDKACAALATTVNTKKLVGIYLENGQVTYTPDAAPWFDLSLYSKMGRTAANEAKWQNTASFQQLLFSILGLSFNNEPYCIYRNRSVSRVPKLIGIETRVGARWPNKAWSGYPELISKLKADGYQCLLLRQRDSISSYLDDIARCSFLFSGDTLAMHVAMTYQIPSIGIFNCTSPAEIHGYGTLQKVVSPLLQQAFYRTDHDQRVIDSVSVEEVFEAFTARLQKV